MDWIKMRCDLREDPAVIGIASELNIEEDLVVGKLHRVWSWANRQTTDGHAASVTATWLDHHVDVTGFAFAMEKVAWLQIKNHEIIFPKFDCHNSESAKKRAISAKRSAKYRHATVTQTSRSERDESVTRGEEIREEKKRKKEKNFENGKYTENFESFWKSYPPRDGRKLGKAKAFTEFEKVPEDRLSDLLRAVRHLRESAQKPKDAERFLRIDRKTKTAPWEEWIGDYIGEQDNTNISSTDDTAKKIKDIKSMGIIVPESREPPNHGK